MASPRPSSGIGATAMAVGRSASAARRAENRRAAASARSPVGLRLKTRGALRRRTEREVGLARRAARRHPAAAARPGRSGGRGGPASGRRRRRPRPADRPAARSRPASPRRGAAAAADRPAARRRSTPGRSAQGPPSSATAAAAPVSATASAKVVGLGRPERLADGATIGRPNAAITACATGCAGARTATVSRPARARSQTRRRIGDRRDDGQRAGPERLGEPLGAVVEPRDARRHGEVRHMGDQRIEARPALGLVEPRHGGGIGGVGGQAVDGLGGQDDQLAGGERLAAAPGVRRYGARCAVSSHVHGHARRHRIGRLSTRPARRRRPAGSAGPRRSSSPTAPVMASAEGQCQRLGDPADGQDARRGVAAGPGRLKPCATKVARGKWLVQNQSWSGSSASRSPLPVDGRGDVDRRGDVGVGEVLGIEVDHRVPAAEAAGEGRAADARGERQPRGGLVDRSRSAARPAPAKARRPARRPADERVGSWRGPPARQQRQHPRQHVVAVDDVVLQRRGDMQGDGGVGDPGQQSRGCGRRACAAPCSCRESRRPERDRRPGHDAVEHGRVHLDQRARRDHRPARQRHGRASAGRRGSASPAPPSAPTVAMCVRQRRRPVEQPPADPDQGQQQHGDADRLVQGSGATSAGPFSVLKYQASPMLVSISAAISQCRAIATDE